MGSLKKDFATDYTLNKRGNGVFAFLLEGEVTINGQKLARRDGLGISDTDKMSITANSDAEILLMEVPMEFQE